MAAEDPSETFAVAEDSFRVEVNADSREELSPSVGHWLSRRVEVAGGSAIVGITVLPGRWMFRVESGNSASIMDQPSARECGAGDVANLVRRWARASGFGARPEQAQGAELRLALTSPTPVRS